MNPILADWSTPFSIAPFDKISDDDFAPALDVALAAHQAEIVAIAENTDAPTFENTIEALERAGAALSKVCSVFFTVAGADSTPAREELQRAFSPKLAAHYAEITANSMLYARVAQLWEQRDSLGLDPEQARLLMLTRRSFVRAGAALEGADAERMKEIKSRLASLGTAFMQNLLSDERDWYMELDEDDLDGLPEFVVEAARKAGEEKGLDRPIITTSRSVITPFLQFSPRRDLREKAFAAWSARGANGGVTDNRGIAAETLALRQEQAALLSYDNFAAYKLEPEMAGTPDRVRD